MTKTIFDNCLVSLTIRRLIIAVSTIVALTSAATFGWFDLKAEVNLAKTQIDSLKIQVSEIRCLLQQQNDWHIYKKTPVGTCD